MTLNEVAPPTKKHERMVKHIKKAYKKDGKLTDDEKSIAYATAWKNYNKKESFEIDKTAHKAASKKAKMRNLAKGNTNPNEKAAAEKKAGGPKLYGEELSRRNKPSAVAKKKKLEKLLIDKEVNKIQKEEMTYQEMIDAGWEMTGEGIWWPPQPETETVTEKLSFSMFKKKAVERKPEKAQDAGARAKRKLARKAHAKYVSGSEDNVPDDIRDHYEVSEGKKKGLWDNIHAKRKRGEKPAKPGDKNYPKTLDVEEGAAWTKKSGKNPSGGLNEKGRKSYERDNPGSDLKAPQPEGGSRKKSFCARMGGMKKKLTSKKTANDPDSRINKALRKWKC